MSKPAIVWIKNPIRKKVIIKLLKRKDVARVMNNKKKLKSMKPQNIGLPSGCKIYINESCKYYKCLWWRQHSTNSWQHSVVLGDKWVNKNQASKRWGNVLLLIWKTWNGTAWKIFVTTTMMEILQMKWMCGWNVVVEMFMLWLKCLHVLPSL